VFGACLETQILTRTVHWKNSPKNYTIAKFEKLFFSHLLPRLGHLIVLPLKETPVS
jgi:hypothetical protein